MQRINNKPVKGFKNRIMVFLSALSIGVLFFSSGAHGQERIGLIFQADTKADFIDSIYSGAFHAGEVQNYSIDLHELSPKQKNLDRWLRNIVQNTRPKALIIVDNPNAPQIQRLLASTKKHELLVGIVNADTDKSYGQISFQIGRDSSLSEGRVAGQYLKQISQNSPLCLSFASEKNNENLFCKQFADGFGQTIYQANFTNDIAKLQKNIQNFLKTYSNDGYVMITDKILLEPLLQIRNNLQQDNYNFKIGFIGQGGNRLIPYLLGNEIAFTTANQPWFQGYWAVSAIALADRFRLTPQKLVKSGPVVIDKNLGFRIQRGQKIEKTAQ